MFPSIHLSSVKGKPAIRSSLLVIGRFSSIWLVLHRSNLMPRIHPGLKQQKEVNLELQTISGLAF